MRGGCSYLLGLPCMVWQLGGSLWIDTCCVLTFGHVLGSLECLGSAVVCFCDWDTYFCTVGVLRVEFGSRCG